MASEFVVFILFLFLLAVIVREDFVFTLLYLFAGAFALGTFWTRKSLASLTYKRIFTDRIYLGEEAPVQLEIQNSGWLPLIWLRVQDSLPADLAVRRTFRQVLSLGPKGKTTFQYLLNGRKRGYYKIGPLFANTGDLLGLLGDLRSEGPNDYLTVYPKIIPLTQIKLPSRSPLGTLRHTQPVFEDPSRVLSKRDYVAGDSLRRVDWKATAVLGRLQVKQFEPSIALETSIFLNLNSLEYDLRQRFDVTELGITIAASIATWVSRNKQAVGLVCNGRDPGLSGEDAPQNRAAWHEIPAVPPRKGKAHLMRILDLLARAQSAESLPFVDLLNQEGVNLPWGTTIILITGQAGDNLFDTIFQVRRAGLSVVLILLGQVIQLKEIERRAEYFHVPFFHFIHERDLDIWRQ